MNEMSTLQERLSRAAGQFDYPETPPIHRAVRLRLSGRSHPRQPLFLRFALLALLLIVAVLVTVPGAAAQLLEFIRIGVVQIFPAPPSPTIGPLPGSATSQAQIPLTATPLSSFTPEPAPPYVITLQGLAGETSLPAARQLLPFDIRLPSLPADLGEPDRVFLQDDEQAVILVWMDPADPERVLLSLHQIGPGGALVRKYEPPVLARTQVDGHPAVWVQGPYLVETTLGDIRWQRLVEGSTLIWENNGITFRLESRLSMEEAQAVAESLE